MKTNKKSFDAEKKTDPVFLLFFIGHKVVVQSVHTAMMATTQTDFVTHKKVMVENVFIDIDAPGFKELGLHPLVFERLRKFNTETPLPLRHTIIDWARRIQDNIPAIVLQALEPTRTIDSIRLADRHVNASDEKRQRLKTFGLHLWKELCGGPEPRRKLDIQALAELFGIVFPDTAVSEKLEIRWDDIRVRDATFCLVRLNNNLPYLHKSQQFITAANSYYGACWTISGMNRKYTRDDSSDIRFGHKGSEAVHICRGNFRLATFPEIVAILACVENADDLPTLYCP